MSRITWEAAITPPEGAENKSPPKNLRSASFPRRTGVVAGCTVADFLIWLLDHKIVHYEHNRGEGIVQSSHVAHICSEFDVDFTGAFVFGFTEDRSQLKIADGHNQLAAILRRYYSGEMTENDLRGEVLARVVPHEKFMDAYINRNNQLRHSSRDRVANPDLCYGSIITEQITPYLTNISKSKISENRAFYNPSCYFIYLMAMKGKEDLLSEEGIEAGEAWRWYNIYRIRSKATRFQNSAKGSLEITDQQAKQLAQAFNFYFRYCGSLEKDLQTDVRPLADSTGWFGLVVSDRLCKDVLDASGGLPRDLDDLVDRTIANWNHLLRENALLMNGPNSEMVRRYKKVVRLMQRSAKRKLRYAEAG